MADYEIITRSSDLEALARDLLKEDVIGVDTEADSFYHYFDKTCLVQVATRRSCYLIDPLALGGPAELAPLAPVFESKKVRVVFHAAEYDIFVLKRDCGFRFSNLYDTMVSAQLLGYPAIGLAAIIEHHFGVVVPKDEQRSDWSRRPLTDKQLKYAAGDVHYLIRLAEKLEKELTKAGRLEWAREEFEALTHRQWAEREFDLEGHQRIKGAKKLDPKPLEILRHLYLMRDARAREIDRPTFKVLGNRTLLEIAETAPRGMADLGRVRGVTELIIRRMGSDILDAVKQGRSSSKRPVPASRSNGNGRRRMDRRTERLVNRLKRWRAALASELSLDPGVLCPNASLEAIAWAKLEKASDLRGVEELKGWLVREFGEEIIDVVKRDDPEQERSARSRPERPHRESETDSDGKRSRERKKDPDKKPARSGGASAQGREAGGQAPSLEKKKKRRRRKRGGDAAKDGGARRRPAARTGSD